ncbi:hypothetical protein C8F04DRAFT_1179262 [Mycena alexandri]|uniref:Uncharacterized protein n=1 Tax=Mycena alexandri TaxID=1745969 RepID=A0AAD6T491_9AGAR|nr:hypothetical protein C8F04DRAFT_1179262 [Mycena alexandri]
MVVQKPEERRIGVCRVEIRNSYTQWLLLRAREPGFEERVPPRVDVCDSETTPPTKFKLYIAPKAGHRERDEPPFSTDFREENRKPEEEATHGPEDHQAVKLRFKNAMVCVGFAGQIIHGALIKTKPLALNCNTEDYRGIHQWSTLPQSLPEVAEHDLTQKYLREHGAMFMSKFLERQPKQEFSLEFSQLIKVFGDRASDTSPNPKQQWISGPDLTLQWVHAKLFYPPENLSTSFSERGKSTVGMVHFG